MPRPTAVRKSLRVAAAHLSPPPDPEARIATLRRLSRFCTCKLGVLQEGLFDGRFSLTQSRVLYEVAG